MARGRMSYRAATHYNLPSIHYFAASYVFFLKDAA